MYQIAFHTLRFSRRKKMRLWHPSLLQELPTKKLSVLHMALCKIKSNRWNKPTAKAWYYNLSWGCFCWYHCTVIRELQGRNVKVSLQWLDWRYRGKRFGLFNEITTRENPTIPYLTTFEEICAETVEKQKSLLIS
jgi:uncharacterized protein (TIGR02328 family)